MKLTLIRYSSTFNFGGATLGLLFINGNFECHTLEDEERIDIGLPKIMKETCIPRGTYKISLCTWGSLNDMYQKRYGNKHEGMLLLNNVPQFEGILIHCGVTDTDTEGCIIVGDKINNNIVEKAIIEESH